MKLRGAMQKIQCKFKQDIPDMGHLEGGSERDVRVIVSYSRCNTGHRLHLPDQTR